MWTLIKYFLITCFLSFCTAFYLLCATPAGLQYDLQWLATQLPGKLIIKKIDGTLLSGFTLYDVSYEAPDQNITFQSIHVAWNPILILKGKYDIKELNIENGRMILTNNPSTSNDTAWLMDLWHRTTLHHLTIKNLAIQQATSTIQLNGDITDHWDIHWKLTALNLKKWFPHYRGTLNSEGTIQGMLNEPTLHATVNISDLAFHEQTIQQIKCQADVTFKDNQSHSIIKFTAFNTQLFDHHYPNITFTAKGHSTLDNKIVSSLFQIAFTNKPLITAHLTLPNYSGLSNPEQTLDAHIELHPTDLTFLLSFNPFIKNPHGILSGNIDVFGKLLQPNMTGEFLVKNMNFLIPKLGIHPEAALIKANLDEQKILTVTGQVRSGTGTAQLNGHINFNLKPLAINLTARGDQLAAVQLSEYTIHISPDVNLLLSYPLIQINGKINVPDAEIKPKNFSSTTTLPDEVILVKQQKPVITSWNTLLNIQLNLGDNINITYDKLQASLAGSVRITKDIDSPAIARGELYSLAGRYNAYGQKLIIDTGRLIYTGNTLFNPGLDITAVKKVKRILTTNTGELNSSNSNVPLYAYAGTEYIKVGVQINGTVEKPFISLFSDPADLNKNDILSYIILGQPQSNASNSQGAAILSVLTTLNPNGTKINRIADKLQATLGLSELNIESIQNFNPNSKSVQSTTSVVIGKQLTKKLSLHYSIGLFDPVSVLNLRYQINPHWALQSETSTVDNGADLLYVIERE